MLLLVAPNTKRYGGFQLLLSKTNNNGCWLSFQNVIIYLVLYVDGHHSSIHSAYTNESTFIYFYICIKYIFCARYFSLLDRWIS